MYVQAPCRSFGMVCTQLHVLVAAEAQALSGASVTEQPRCLPLGARSGRARTEAAAGAAPQQVASNVTCKTGTMPDMASPTQSTHTDRRLLLSLSNAHMAITVNSQRQRNSRSNTPSIGALIIFFFFFFFTSPPLQPRDHFRCWRHKAEALEKRRRSSSASRRAAVIEFCFFS